ncbi:tyrosine-type recombinase/integrase [Comamonas thiooxydans]|uniref:tyrosine-type recombinase/integrase n=1 Tax=Comamonas thiooxydans TaxID=363952 RepID=UPI001186AA25|nr:hypothetical protein [Comamonas thiooxydans]
MARNLGNWEIGNKVLARAWQALPSRLFHLVPLMSKKQTFSSLASALALPAPTSADATEYAHESQAGFYVRVHKERADGAVRRSYVARYLLKDAYGKTKSVRETLGLVETLGVEEAKPFAIAQADALRNVHRAKSKLLGNVKATLKDAYDEWESKQTENRGKPLSPDYQAKIRQVWRTFLEPMGDNFLDEMQDEHWMRFLELARRGRVKSLLGKEYSAKSASAAKNVINTVSHLYKVAHEMEALKHMPPDWDPTRKAYSDIEPANKRENRIHPTKFPDLWIALDQLMAPWWRDLFKVFLFTGLRDSLVMDMRWDQIDFNEHTLEIPVLARGTKRSAQALSMKGRTATIVLPLSSEVMRILQARYRMRPSGALGEWVWYGPKGTGATQKRLTDPRAAWSVLEPFIGFMPIKHDLRRTFANLGSSLASQYRGAISSLMLHSTQKTAKEAGLAAITLEYAGDDIYTNKQALEIYTRGVLELAQVIPQTDLTRKFRLTVCPVLEEQLRRESRVIDAKPGGLLLPSPYEE